MASAKLAPSLKFMLLFTLLLAAVFPVKSTDLARTPLIPATLAKPNVIFGMDDSGSMDFEVMLNTNDGALWWNDALALPGLPVGSGWDAKGAPLYNESGSSGTDWTKLVHLFPLGCSSAGKTICDASGHYTVPPTAQFAWLRSSAYNPIYYDPTVTYQPWTSASIAGVLRPFDAPVPQAAPSHPLFSLNTVNLSATVANATALEFLFRIQPGMQVPAGTRTRTVNAKNGTITWPAAANTYVSTTEFTASMDYYPATYWVRETCSSTTGGCAKAPDGTSLKRYEIKSGATFPSGRAYADELQNFANWFTYYRKRKLMLAASAGQVLDSLPGMNLGLVEFNGNANATMYDTDAASHTANAKVIIGNFYSNSANGGTPTRETLKFIGEQFRLKTNIIKYSCQKNAAFIMTDGFAHATPVAPPTYLAATYGKGAPYETTFKGSLADIALSYYTNAILHGSLVKGQVPATAPTKSNPQNDGNPDLHVNTYAMTMGAQGTLWPRVSSDAYANPVTWPNPDKTRSPTAVDDLWHATINGRGQMFTASTPGETARSISEGLSRILASAGSQSAVAFSTVNIRPNEALGFAGSYSPAGWSGDISAYPVDTVSGELQTNQRTWSASALLDARDYTTRAIGTYNGTQGVALADAAVWSARLSAKEFPGSIDSFAAYLRGDRASEGSMYRVRSGRIGPVVNAEPVSWLEDDLVYAASNDGLLHALDKATGTELWAYAPRFVQGDMAAQSKLGVTFTTTLDGTPVVAKISAKQTVLIGGRGTAGPGYYALDVSNPRGAPGGTGPVTQTDQTVASRVLWEFPNASAPADTGAALGASVGKPVLARLPDGKWVTLLTSGYNSKLDGKGRLFMLDAITGKWLATLVTPAGSLGAGDAGLAQVTGVAEKDGTVQYAFGGDLLGNVWKFDLVSRTVVRLATLTNIDNFPLPVTAAPEVSTFSGQRMLFIGTGKLLGTTDFKAVSTNSFFALFDGPEINSGYTQQVGTTNLRRFLAPRLLTVSTGAVTGAALKASERGWYVDMPKGEQANTDPSLGLGLITWTTNFPSETSCSSGSALYFADAKSGLALPASAFSDGLPQYRVAFSTTLSSRPVISRLPSGRLAISTHQSNNTTDTRTFNVPSAKTGKPAKLAWRQVLR